MLDSSENSSLFSLCPDYSDCGGRWGRGPRADRGEHAEVTQRCPEPSHYYCQLPPSGPNLWKWADKMNQVCSVFLQLHGWHVISSEQVSERWGINDGVTEMCSSPICCNAAMFTMLFRTLSPCHRLIIRKLAAVFSKACMRKYVLNELMSSGCLCLCGGPLLLIYRGTHFTDY